MSHGICESARFTQSELSQALQECRKNVYNEAFLDGEMTGYRTGWHDANKHLTGWAQGPAENEAFTVRFGREDSEAGTQKLQENTCVLDIVYGLHADLCKFEARIEDLEDASINKNDG